MDTVGGGGHEDVVNEHSATLVARDADVRLPRELTKPGLVAAYDSFGKLRYSLNATF